MPDIIHLLPDSVANQIAAGEVVQRPASAVKELMENAVDAGADRVSLIVKDAGKTLIQIIDNGCGMSETDARMSIERHATSKISKADELWHIRTKGFRGEALASIAAIAQVELKSRLREEELGTKLVIEGSEVKAQEPCATPHGTSVAVKNLFYNTPARRNFLKSEAVEMRHIVEEFERVALAHPDVGFSLHHNDNELFNVKKSTLRQRVVSLFGPRFNERLVPVKESTDIVTVEGFIGKPEFAKKTRGEQYFFVNDRFIKNGYLHHAVKSAFDELIPRNAHPTYFLYLKVDPHSIDVNIHPTKTEVKFTEDRAIYAIIRSAVRNSLGKYNIAPSLDFDREESMDIAPLPQNVRVSRPQTKDLDFNPFEVSTTGGSGAAMRPGRAQPLGGDWQELYRISEKQETGQQAIFDAEGPLATSSNSRGTVMELGLTYILAPIKSGFVLVHRRRAYERILYEQALASLDRQTGLSQQRLFSQTLELNAADCALIEDLKEDLFRLGFTIEGFGTGTFVVNGVPADAGEAEVQNLIEGFLEQYKNAADPSQNSRHERVARSMAAALSSGSDRAMAPVEMLDLIDRLFACDQPRLSPRGKPVLITYDLESINKKFKAE